jgi:hypothetical protein
MMLIAWVWYTKLFARVWGQYSGEAFPMRAEGESCMSYMKRTWARGLAQFLFSAIAVFSLVTVLAFSRGSFFAPVVIVLVFYLPVIGSRVLWMKGLTARQKGTLLGIDLGYALVALYAVFGVFLLLNTIAS